MVVFSCWIYDRHTRCIFHRDYDTMATNTHNDSDNAKLLYGMIQSLRTISQQLVPKTQSKDYQNSLSLSSTNRVKTIKTLLYSIHLKETITGTKIVVLTDNNVAKDKIELAMDTIYTKLLVPYLAANPMAVKCSSDDSIIIRNSNFINQVDRLLQPL